MDKIVRKVLCLEEEILLQHSQKEELALCRVGIKCIREMKFHLSFPISENDGLVLEMETSASRAQRQKVRNSMFSECS